MSTRNVSPGDIEQASDGRMEAIVLKAKKAFSGTRWLKPVMSLRGVAGAQFGRKIEASIRQLSEGNGIVKINLRRRDAAVVMTVDRYHELMALKQTCEQLLEAEADRTLSDAADDFERLYQRITSNASAAAADSLFDADEEALRASFRPGRTEAE